MGARVGAALFLLCAPMGFATGAHAQDEATPPPEVSGVVWCQHSKICLSWTAVPEALSYAVYRGTAASLHYLLESTTDSCRVALYTNPTTGTNVTPVPETSGLYWYLVTARSSGGEGTAGDGSGAPRVLNSSGNCPASCKADLVSCSGPMECCSGQCEAGLCRPPCHDARTCSLSCTPSQIACPAVCSDITVDPANCGACGAACSTKHVTPACTNGVCTGSCQTFPDVYADCNGDLRSDGCEIDLYTDPLHCQSCNTACSTNHVTPWCASGYCGGVCDPGWGDCDGNLKTNGCEASLSAPPYCGGTCTAACSTNHIVWAGCSGTACVGPSCAAGWYDCDQNLGNGCESNLRELANCGSCGHACPNLPGANPVCSTTGTCGFECLTWNGYHMYGDCDHDPSNGCETYLYGSNENCGACGNNCNDRPYPGCQGTCTHGNTCVLTSCP